MPLRFLYHKRSGRLLLKLMIRPSISRLGGKVCDSSLSRRMIPRFIHRYGIDMSEYEAREYTSFNDFFTRPIRKECRPIDEREDSLVSPSDGLLSTYRIEDGLVIPVKESRYAISDLVRDEELARRYDGGMCLVFRLCVDNYHRYIYPVSGVKSEDVSIPGKLHTVRPIALRVIPVFTENARTYTLIDTGKYGQVLQMEVGALFIGRIVNYDGAGPVKKGSEKGKFMYGGSTVILLLEKDRARLLAQYEACSEVPVKMGCRIAELIGTEE